MENKVCCFFGHRKISVTDELKKRVFIVCERLITEKGVGIFLFGSKSEFDLMCREVMSELKQKFPHITRVYVRAEYRYINERYEKYLLKSSESTFYCPLSENAGKYTYIKRNTYMVDKSDFCVVYFDDGYILSQNGKSSGTRLAYYYAMQENKNIINVFQR